MTEAAVEGSFDFEGWSTWYRVVGSPTSDRVPILTLHGGPGMSSGYLVAMEALAEAGRQVVFYDQIGSRRSPGPDEPSFYDLGLFVRQIEAVRRELGLARVHLLGQSWGGMLALEVALRNPEGLTSLVLCSALASVAGAVREMNRLADEMGIGETVRAHSAAGTTESAEYLMAYLSFLRRHVCRLDPIPDYLIADALGQNQMVSHHLYGSSDFTGDGVLQDWDVRSRLGEIDVPTLVTGGRYDECTTAMQEEIHAGIPGSRLVIFEESAHTNFAEEPDRFCAVVNDFLAEVDN